MAKLALCVKGSAEMEKIMSTSNIYRERTLNQISESDVDKEIRIFVTMGAYLLLICVICTA